MEFPLDVQAILESVADSLIAFGRDGRFLLVTPNAGELFAKSPTELIGRTIEECLPDMVQSELHRRVMQSLVDRCDVRFDQFHPPVNRWFEHKIHIQENGSVA